MKKIKVVFYGVRGSVSVSSRETVKYGGNTPCVYIEHGGTRIICDAGTGIRTLGADLCKEGRVSATILLSHYHWDHIAGLPFFNPIYNKDNEFKIVGPETVSVGPKELLTAAISDPYFPISLSSVPAKIGFFAASERPFFADDVEIIPFRLNHPGGALGYRLNFSDGKGLVYVSDNEPTGDDGAFIEWATGADIMIHDAQYTPAEYKKHKGWGHSSYDYPLKLASEAGIGRLILSHFDPSYVDSGLDKISSHLKQIIRQKGYRFKCELAKEGMVAEL